jgi:tannase/feruloyl esterase
MTLLLRSTLRYRRTEARDKRAASGCMMSVIGEEDRRNGWACGRGGASVTSGFLRILAFVLVPALPIQAASCESLSLVALPNATITSAQTVAPGQFVPPGGDARATEAFKNVPSFCRIAATSRPSADSDIRIEVWLPAMDWNGNFRVAGNGNWGGAINYVEMASILRGGFATASTDTGHEGTSVNFALGHPEKLKDFGYRAFHEMTTGAKTLATAFYGPAPKLSYIAECGGGSREALSEIQRFPEDYDAAGVWGFDGYKTLMHFGQLWVYAATHQDPGRFIPPEKYSAIHQAVLDQCDAKVDGINDGVIEDPPRCHFDPKALLCKGPDGPTCLTPAQVDAVRAIYSPVTNPRTKKAVYSSLYPGSELGWSQLGGAQPFPNAVEFLRWVVFADRSWEYKNRPPNFDSDLALASQPEKTVINADNPDIKKFIARGGKLLIVEGWADAAIAPGGAVRYYTEALAKSGNSKAVRDSMRLFMVPGMGHCPGVNGAENYDVDGFKILQDWKQSGKAPDRLIATHYKSGKEVGQRLVCAYPRVAVYRGSGAAEDPANFSCKMPK